MRKVLLSVDEKLLSQIDHRARSHGLSRSGYIAELARRDTAAGRTSVVAALESIDRLFAHARSDDATLAIRAERDTR